MAGKGVLLEGLEVVLIVAALGAGPEGLAPAIAGAAVAVLFVVGLGVVLHRPLARLPESHLKYAVGVVLSSFGVFFLGEGLGVEWPGGDVALLYLARRVRGRRAAAGRGGRRAPPGGRRPDARAAQARARRDVDTAARRVRSRSSLALVLDAVAGDTRSGATPAGSCYSPACWRALAVLARAGLRRRR